MAAAGPGVNVLLALVFGLIVRFGYGTLSEPFIVLASLIVLINVMLAFFNLLPIPPLDGSKLLKSLLPLHASMTLQRVEAMLVGSGLLVMLLVFWLLISIIGPFIFAAVSFIFGLITGIPLNTFM